MVILITGAIHCSKTLLAQRLLEKYKYPYLSIDLLKMGLIRSGRTSLSPEEDSELTRYLWPILREIIKTDLENPLHRLPEQDTRQLRHPCPPAGCQTIRRYRNVGCPYVNGKKTGFALPLVGIRRDNLFIAHDNAVLRKENGRMRSLLEQTK